MSDRLDLNEYRKYFSGDITDQTPLVMFHGKVMNLIAEVERLQKGIETLQWLEGLILQSLGEGTEQKIESLIKENATLKEKLECLNQA